MNFLENLVTLPMYIYLQLIVAFVTGFIIWRKRDSLSLRSENIFDFIFLFILFGFLFGRLFYIIEHLSEFKGISWSIYPYFYEPGAERIWFKLLPWVAMKFWEGGINYAGLLFGGILYTLLRFRKYVKEYPPHIFVEALCIGNIIHFLGLFLGGLYWGKVTDLWFGIVYSQVDDQLRIPIQVIEIVAIFIFIVLVQYMKKVGKSKYIFAFYVFILGWLQIISIYFQDIEIVSGVTFTQAVYLLVVISGLILFVVDVQMDISSISSYDKGEVGKEKSPVDLDQTTARSSRMQYGYRDFQSSFSTYRNPKPSVFSKIKRSIQRLIRSFF